MSAAEDLGPDLGVVVVSYAAEDVIALCLESLMAARETWAAATGGRLRVVVVDNASPDGTVACIRDWATGAAPLELPAEIPFEMLAVAKPLVLREGGPEMDPAPGSDLDLVQTGANLGFAGGVNTGLAYLARDPAIGRFWVLNPDSMVPAPALSALAEQLAQQPDFGLLGGRVMYLERPELIQIDGGLIKRWTGVTGNYNLLQSTASPPPDPAALDFITGASVVASRAFYEAVGPMREDYFLYYEEVDWALRRGDFTLAYAKGFEVYHWGGTAIGSPVVGRAASPFSLYFKHRGRIRFQRRFHPWALPVAWAYSLALAVREGLLRRSPVGAWAILTASFGLPAPRAVRDRLSPEAAARAFGRPADG